MSVEPGSSFILALSDPDCTIVQTLDRKHKERKKQRRRKRKDRRKNGRR
jgi:hypothetical protein